MAFKAKQELTGTFEDDAEVGEVVTGVPGREQGALLAHHERQAITSYADALAMLATKGLDVLDAQDELSDGFELVDKEELVNVPFVVVDWTVKWSDEYNAHYAVVRCVTKNDTKVVFTDGSTGICDSLRQYELRKGKTPLVCAKGLKVSKYPYVDKTTGERTMATTYYLV